MKELTKQLRKLWAVGVLQKISVEISLIFTEEKLSYTSLYFPVITTNID